MTFFRFGPSPLSVKSTVLAFALVAPVTSACAQSTSPPQGSNPPAATNEEPSLQRRPLDIENSQPDPHEQYLLGPGDDITVTVSGRPELSGAQIVGPDGRITLPVAGSVEVGDKSRDDAAKAIDQALSNYYSGAISSTVQVTKYGSNHILLLGAVEHPGVITFDDPPTLLEAITKGGAVINADRTTQTARKCIIYRGKDEVMNVNLSDKFDSQKALLDIRLRRNDIVYVPENQESLISVLGEVGKPGPVRLNRTARSLHCWPLPGVLRRRRAIRPSRSSLPRRSESSESNTRTWSAPRPAPTSPCTTATRSLFRAAAWQRLGSSSSRFRQLSVSEPFSP